MGTLLWEPGREQVEQSNIYKFIRYLHDNGCSKIKSYDDLYRFSILNQELFWSHFWDFANIKAKTKGESIIANFPSMFGTSYFPEARLNFAENLLSKNNDEAAIIFWGEDKIKLEISWQELNNEVSKLQQFFIDCGVKSGDRIVAILPNTPHSCIAMLATTSLGAIWASCSPDFGEDGILSRFQQIKPKILLSSNGYYYNGKWFAIEDKLSKVIAKLPTVENTLIFSYPGTSVDISEKTFITWDNQVMGYNPKSIIFTSLPFDHHLYILFSSGTTGKPKCIAHRAGGVLLKHKSELLLHCNLKPAERLFYFTTCGWMMWNWLMSGLSVGSTIILYDGSPFAPSGDILFDYAQEVNMNIFGTSAKYIDAVHKAGLKPANTHDLSSLRSILSTGSPLSEDGFEFVYKHIKSDVHLASISGGTDIVGCFVLGNPTKPVWKGEIQGPAIGIDIDIFSDDGTNISFGKGELVCKSPFPSMPLEFWNDTNGDKYRNAYFSRFPGIWCHGDFAEWTKHGGIIIHGRSDATLNPGGVRIGTAEIYAQAELLPEVLESIAIGQDWDNDVRIILFVKLQSGYDLTDSLINKIKQQIKAGASPRHVPAKIIAVRDIPRTKSGKITEIAVRDVVHGREVKNIEALANPDALDLYRNLKELCS